MVGAARPCEDSELLRLQAALTRWIHEAGPCAYCHAGHLAHRIVEEARGRQPVGAFVVVWEDGEEVAGIAITGRFGNVFDLFAAPALRGSTAELAMLDTTAAATADRLGEAGDEVVTDVYGCDEVRAALLRQLGFAPFRVFDDITYRPLRDPVPLPRLPAGFAIRAVTRADGEGLAEVRRSAFGDRWGPREYRDRVMVGPGYDPARELVVVAPEGRIAGFTRIWLDDLNRVGLFEPVGTHADFRRRGLARALMLHALRVMTDAGMDTARVEHDTTNAPAAALYRSLGFVRRDQTHGYRRPTSAGG